MVLGLSFVEETVLLKSEVKHHKKYFPFCEEEVPAEGK